MNAPITTHVLDTSTGRPAAGVAVFLQAQDGADWKELARAVTDSNGRVAAFIVSEKLAASNYRLRFDTGAYFASRRAGSFYPYVEITLAVTDPEQHYHVPLLLSPYGYTTYRGS